VQSLLHKANRKSVLLNVVGRFKSKSYLSTYWAVSQELSAHRQFGKKS